MKHIGLKVLNVMAEVGKVAKDKTNSFHKYDYASDEAVVGSIRSALIKNKLIAIPHQKSCQVDGELTTLCVEYRLIDTESGEEIVSCVYGQGQDKGDKGTYKAATGAEKYFLLKTFLIATGDDAEKESPERKIKPSIVRPYTPTVKEASQSEENTLTSFFELSEPIASKKGGKFYRKAIDAEGVSYFVFDDHVLQDLNVASGKEVTVKIDTSTKWPRITEVVSGGIENGLPA